jgi:hypothetical protein
MITVRTIGYHENAPKTSSKGRRKTTVESPPFLTHVAGVRRARDRDGAASGLLMNACCVFSTVDVTGSIVDIAAPRIAGSGPVGP